MLWQYLLSPAVRLSLRASPVVLFIHLWLIICSLVSMSLFANSLTYLMLYPSGQTVSLGLKLTKKSNFVLCLLQDLQ